MPGRREQVLDAAIAVLGTHGSRGLTYQAVDRAARAPAGTTSNHFRNRTTLIDGVVAHLERLDRREWESLTERLRPTDIDTLTETLAMFVRHAIGAGRSRTAARYALFLEAAAHPELRAPLTRGRAAILGWASRSLRQLGSDAHCGPLLDYLDGVILHQVSFPDPEYDPAPGIRIVLAGLLDTLVPD